jgi:hypothetical protein
VENANVSIVQPTVFFSTVHHISRFLRHILQVYACAMCVLRSISISTILVEDLSLIVPTTTWRLREIQPYDKLDYTALRCTAMHCMFRIVMYRTILHCTYCLVQQFIVLHCCLLHCTAVSCPFTYCPIVYSAVLYCTVLYCTVLFYRNALHPS